ncbi:MAG: hypothetical protein Q8L26_08825 [Candidatus Omnitrophota bacterium]|nr:hypothetical protein [Candidatus Omnitrophota bacterium]
MRKIIFLCSVLMLAGMFCCFKQIYAFDKAEMDQTLREELAKIPDLETKQAILDEYKEVIREKMPELNIDEATCQSCEEDIKVLEKELLASLDKGNIDPGEFSGGKEKLLEKQKVYKTITTSNTVMQDQTSLKTRTRYFDADGNPACGCDSTATAVTDQVAVTTQVPVTVTTTSTVEAGETVAAAQ